MFILCNELYVYYVIYFAMYWVILRDVLCDVTRCIMFMMYYAVDYMILFCEALCEAILFSDVLRWLRAVVGLTWNYNTCPAVFVVYFSEHWVNVTEWDREGSWGLMGRWGGGARLLADMKLSVLRVSLYKAFTCWTHTLPTN